MFATAVGVALASLAVATACGPVAAEPAAPKLRPPGARVLSDTAAAARVIRSPSETRPVNARANRTVPTAAELARFRRLSRGQGVARHVTGRFTGTTDDIIEWAAQKWGIDPDLLRAQAVAETKWRQYQVGDGGRSFGLMQIKRTIWLGSHPLSERSTAFNVDLAASILRQAYDGRATWYRPRGYRAGDLWNSLGAYFSGRWKDPGGRAYVGRVRRQLAERAWSRYGS